MKEKGGTKKETLVFSTLNATKEGCSLNIHLFYESSGANSIVTVSIQASFVA